MNLLYDDMGFTTCSLCMLRYFINFNLHDGNKGVLHKDVIRGFSQREQAPLYRMPCATHD